ncbi:MAG: CocE/NonD family hydrolase [Myxococcales bacterium]|nr:CocE/NonD family hydrolase [Myxococcales bacterium]
MRPSRDVDPSHEGYLRARPATHTGFDRRSLHLTMRDGVRIAVDVCLPVGARGRLPTIVRQTRYLRRFAVHPLLRPLLPAAMLDPMNAPMRALFTSRGYAWVDVDVRGSGASFGERPCPWWLDGEVADGREIVEWIVHQPWSSGLVGSTGVSYEGTTAEFLSTVGHPAVRAVAPRFSLFDVYTDVAFPGGLHNAYFTHAWETANAALDRNDPGVMVALIYALQAYGAFDPALVRRLDHPALRAAVARVVTAGLAGVARVDDDQSGEALAAALRSHAENYSTHAGAVHVTFRDDAPPDAPVPGQGSDFFSPHTYVDRVHDVAVLGYGGWFDGAYASSAIRRFEALSARGLDARLLVGPWIHGGQLDLDPGAPGPATQFDHAAELLRFFDPHLIPERRGEDVTPRVRTWELGEGGFHSHDVWPPPGATTRVLHLDVAGLLRDAPTEGACAADVTRTTGAGPRSRYRTLLCPFLHADGSGRSGPDAFTFESPPLGDLTVAGHPILVLHLASSEPDDAVFAYLDDVDPLGRARLVSEGNLRTLHRTSLTTDTRGLPRMHATFLRADALRLAPDEPATHCLELLPLHLRVRPGHRLRLRLTGADVDHFTTPPGPSTVRWRIDVGRSRLLLPVVPR